MMKQAWWVDGDTIRRLRASGHLIEELVAHRSRLSVFSLRLFEHAAPGAFQPHPPQVVRVAQALRVSPLALVGGDHRAFERSLSACRGRFS